MYQRRTVLTPHKLTILVVACVFALCFLATEPQQLIPTQGSVGSIQRIVIDAGHGGADGGAVGVHDELEKEVNLKIAKNLKEFFALSGMEVVMTRDEDVSIHDKDCKTLSEQKRSDIYNRLKIMEKDKNSLVISVHQNKYEESSSRGAQMFYGQKNKESKEWADYLQREFVANLQQGNTREIKEGPHSVYLLTHATVPIVLVECGFLSNPEEAELLMTTEYQQKIAFTIYSATMKYLQENG